jgi:hypothetical protein
MAAGSVKTFLPFYSNLCCFQHAHRNKADLHDIKDKTLLISSLGMFEETSWMDCKINLQLYFISFFYSWIRKFHSVNIPRFELHGLLVVTGPMLIWMHSYLCCALCILGDF